MATTNNVEHMPNEESTINITAESVVRLFINTYYSHASAEAEARVIFADYLSSAKNLEYLKLFININIQTSNTL